MIQTTLDNFLGGSLKIAQPIDGYRAGSDAVLLASFLSSQKGHILDVGCGVGTVSLCAAYRLPNIAITGIDCQDDLIHLAKENALLNQLQNRVEFVKTDIENCSIDPNSFDHVISNPPYFDQSAPAPDPSRALARSAKMSLKKWMDFCIKMTKPRGYISFIYPANGLSLALQAIPSLGDINIIPLWPKEGHPAHRCLIRGRKDSKTVSTVDHGLILHQSDGSYSHKAHGLLWDGNGF